LLDVVGEHFSKFYKPGCALSIDEAMIKFDGRLSWKQYMPKNPTKWGMKLWCLCDSVTGYCLKFDVKTCTVWCMTRTRFADRKERKVSMMMTWDM